MRLMANTYNLGHFSPREPDLIMEELVAVLSRKTSFEFKPLYNIIYTNLAARNSARGSAELFRLRVYEKLQFLVGEGMVKKSVANGVKKYRGMASLATVIPILHKAHAHN